MPYTYTAIIEPIQEVEFIINHHFQQLPYDPAQLTFELLRTDTKTGVYDTRVAVRADGAGNYHLYSIADNGTIIGTLFNDCLLYTSGVRGEQLPDPVRPQRRYRPHGGSFGQAQRDR